MRDNSLEWLSRGGNTRETKEQIHFSSDEDYELSRSGLVSVSISHVTWQRFPCSLRLSMTDHKPYCWWLLLSIHVLIGMKFQEFRGRMTSTKPVRLYSLLIFPVNCSPPSVSFFHFHGGINWRIEKFPSLSPLFLSATSSSSPTSSASPWIMICKSVRLSGWRSLWGSLTRRGKKESSFAYDNNWCRWMDWRLNFFVWSEEYMHPSF